VPRSPTTADPTARKRPDAPAGSRESGEVTQGHARGVSVEVGRSTALSQLPEGIALDIEKRSDHEEKEEEGSRWAMSQDLRNHQQREK